MKYLVGMYSVTVLIAVGYFEIWGVHAHDSFFANLGRAAVWPAVMFPVLGRIVGGLVWVVVIVAILLLVRRR